LMQLARCYGTTVQDIRAANYIPIPDRIYPGAVLSIPNPGNAGPITINEMPCFVYHTVQHGQNLSQIAQAYGINLHWLARINAVYNYNYIQAGQLLVIPNPVPPELTVAPRR
jgi:LysM repeat protein